MKRKIIPILIALFLSVLFVEGLLHIIPVKVLDLGRSHHQAFCQYDPILGWWHKSGHTARYVTDEYSVELSFNSDGIRGPEYSKQKPSSTYRVLVLGDSFAEGYSAPFSHLFSEYLKRDLSKRIGRPVEVINAGIGGFSTDQQLIYFRTRGRYYRPDLTIVLFYFNDVLANSQPGFHRGYKPFFTLNNQGGLVLKNVPVPVPETEDKDDSQERKPFYILPRTRTMLLRVIEHLPILPWLNPEKQREDMNLTETVAVKAGGPIPAEYFAWRTSPGPMMEKSWIMTEAVLAEFKRDAVNSGGQLMIFYVPEKLSVYENLWNNLKLKYNMPSGLWDVTEDERRLKEICRRQGIECVFPLAQYKSETAVLSAKGKSLFFDIDEHWNIRGHKFTGELLSNEIMDRFLGRK